jgi:hypothetical protein
MRWIVLAFLTLSGCYPDVGTVVNVGPSAEHRIEEIAQGVDDMNEVVGYDVFTLRIVDSDERIDGEIVVRHRDEAFDHPKQSGHTERTVGGVIIEMLDRCNARCLMHELGHAAGLEHVDDEENMMFKRWGSVLLTESQKRKILMLDDGYRRGER